jgi:hypothetical protein
MPRIKIHNLVTICKMWLQRIWKTDKKWKEKERLLSKPRAYSEASIRSSSLCICHLFACRFVRSSFCCKFSVNKTMLSHYFVILYISEFVFSPSCSFMCCRVWGNGDKLTVTTCHSREVWSPPLTILCKVKREFIEYCGNVLGVVPGFHNN